MSDHTYNPPRYTHLSLRDEECEAVRKFIKWGVIHGPQNRVPDELEPHIDPAMSVLAKITRAQEVLG